MHAFSVVQLLKEIICSTRIKFLFPSQVDLYLEGLVIQGRKQGAIKFGFHLKKTEKLEMYPFVYLIFSATVYSHCLCQTLLESVRKQRYRVYKSAHVKYGIYKPREVEHPIKKQVRLRTSFFF